MGVFLSFLSSSKAAARSLFPNPLKGLKVWSDKSSNTGRKGFYLNLISQAFRSATSTMPLDVGLMAEGQGESKGAELDNCKMVRHLTLMTLSYSKITSKSQTVIPREVRERLKLKPGDRLRYVVTPGGVRIEKAERHSEDDPFAVFTEWSSAADEKAYDKL
jgi:antitoxin PrlF